ncbi:PEP-CTERM sorting domain-containing protein [Rubellicoccus peritrichatus]|uniref:PEP-CTERM sorting domain-containing protein n=1 Tax=Rubellicoccus peritrichatus TaxID=3080537 RepID=A0AAQ3L8Z4_9BACT|nr:PEP-CTERM sorting domain-containing protein [Puniceicoccus sp. CR14]WOO40134.1 PEP-CTERM sorting domain-containing protein [Puniceicoccus sp. CR14]
MNYYKTLLILCLALFGYQSHAAISFTYNNTTGDYSLSGSDPGPGLPNSTLLFVWLFANNSIGSDARTIMTEIIADGGLTGTIDGNPIVSVQTPLLFGGDLTLAFLDPMTPGELILNTANGTIAPGLASLGDFNYTGTPFTGSTTEDINPIPEPGTYAALFGLAVMSFVTLRRRK